MCICVYRRVKGRETTSCWCHAAAQLRVGRVVCWRRGRKVRRMRKNQGQEEGRELEQSLSDTYFSFSHNCSIQSHMYIIFECVIFPPYSLINNYFITKYGSTLYIGIDEIFGPLSLYIRKFQLCTVIFSYKPPLTQLGNSWGQYVCLTKIWWELDHKHGRYGKKSISPILLVVVVVLLLFEFQFLKTHKRYIQVWNFVHKLEPMTQHAVTCQNLCKWCSLRVNNNNALP